MRGLAISEESITIPHHFLSLWVVGVLVRMVLEGEPAVSLLDVILGRLLWDLQEGVERLPRPPFDTGRQEHSINPLTCSRGANEYSRESPEVVCGSPCAPGPAPGPAAAAL